MEKKSFLMPEKFKVDPLVKAENFAVSLRKEKKQNYLNKLRQKRKIIEDQVVLEQFEEDEKHSNLSMEAPVEEDQGSIKLTPKYLQHFEKQNLKGMAISLRRAKDLEKPLKVLMKRKAMQDVMKLCTAESIQYVLQILVTLSSIGNHDFTYQMIEDGTLEKVLQFINADNFELFCYLIGNIVQDNLVCKQYVVSLSQIHTISQEQIPIIKNMEPISWMWTCILDFPEQDRGNLEANYVFQDKQQFKTVWQTIQIIQSLYSQLDNEAIAHVHHCQLNLLKITKFKKKVKKLVDELVVDRFSQEIKVTLRLLLSLQKWDKVLSDEIMQTVLAKYMSVELQWDEKVTCLNIMQNLTDRQYIQNILFGQEMCKHYLNTVYLEQKQSEILAWLKNIKALNFEDGNRFLEITTYVISYYVQQPTTQTLKSGRTQQILHKCLKIQNELSTSNQEVLNQLIDAFSGINPISKKYDVFDLAMTLQHSHGLYQDQDLISQQENHANNSQASQQSFQI